MADRGNQNLTLEEIKGLFENPEFNQMMKEHVRAMSERGEDESPRISETEKRLNNTVSELSEALKEIKQEGLLANKRQVDLDHLSKDIEAFPLGFHMPQVPKYHGIGSPTAHLTQYARIMLTAGATRAQITSMLPTTLDGGALIWYNRQPADVQTDWDALTSAFIKYYNYNSFAEVKIQDLERVRQKYDEPFAEYYKRWLEVMAQLKNKLDEDELVIKLIDGSLDLYKDQLKFQRLKTFEAVYETAMQIELFSSKQLSSRRSEDFQKTSDAEQSSQSYSRHRQNQASKQSSDGSVNVAAVNRSQNPVRGISPWPAALTAYFAKCRRLGLLQSLKPFVPCANEDIPNFCSYHVEVGHHTNFCHSLKEALQNLVQEGKIEDLASLDTSKEVSRKSTKQVNMIQSGMPENFVLAQIMGANPEAKDAMTLEECTIEGSGLIDSTITKEESAQEDRKRFQMEAPTCTFEKPLKDESQESLMKSAEVKSMIRAELANLIQSPEFKGVLRAELSDFCQSPQFRSIVKIEIQAAIKDLGLAPEIEKVNGISYHDKLKGKCHVQDKTKVELEQVVETDASIDEMIVWKVDPKAEGFAKTGIKTTSEISLSPVQDSNIPTSVIDMDMMVVPEGMIPNLETIPNAVFDKWAAEVNSVPNEEQKTPQGPWSLACHFAKCRKLGLLQSLKTFTPCAKEDIPRFCTYHVEVGHHTNSCRRLREKIIKLIREGKLKGLAIEDIQGDKRRKMKN